MRSFKLSKEVELLISVVGASQALYLSLSVFLGRKRDLKNTLLGLLFLTLTLRIVKSLLWVYLESTPDWLINLGFIAHLSFGPLLFLYVYHFVFDKAWSHLSFLHFIPAAIVSFFVFSFTVHNFWYSGGYASLLFQQMGYATAGVILLFIGLGGKSANRNVLRKKDKAWLIILVSGTLLIQAAYFSNYILGLTPYLLGPVIYAVFFYFLSFFALQHPQIFSNRLQQKKYKHIHISGDRLKRYSDQLRELMIREKPYLNSNCSLKQIASKLHLPPYLVSHIINKEFSQTFPYYINAYRIQEARLLLESQDYRHIKISSIAYECGFNSLSSFNMAFKKHMRLTPSEYRNRLMNL